MMLAALLLAAAVHTDFEGGNLGKVERLSESHFRCHVQGESDQDKRNRQATWYFFRVDGAAGKALTIDMVDLPGEYNYRPNRGAITGETPPVYSYDRKTWKHFETTAYDREEPRLTLRITPTSDRLWIAHVPPYTNADLDRLLSEFAGHRHLRRKVIGKTVQGRDLLLLTVTNPVVAAAGKKVVWLMFRQHSWEAGSSWVGEGALRFLLSDDTAARRLRDRTIFQIFPLCDPDGVARGGVRFNAHGYDLNRNWDAADPRRTPEIAAQRKAVLDWVDAGRRLDLFLSLHNTETAEYLDGPPGAEHRALGERFFRLLRETTTFNPTRPLRQAQPTTTAGKPGRMTVNQGLYQDRKLPAFLMEQMIAFNRRLGRFPTVHDRLVFGRELVQAAAQSLE
jgi:hypothetical protein